MCRRAACLFVALLAACVPAADPKAKPTGKANRLAGESSPYLLQHAHNPVDWRPWGAEAFAEAQKTGKLVFLSIGYSSCHWCHVMERESFSNEEIAKQLNDNFVCIKVDREERPDIDDVYLTAVQATGIGGGWPLTVFLTQEGKPIFGGTYIPPEDKKLGEDTIPGMKSTLKRVVELNKEKGKELLAQADAIAEKTQQMLDRNAAGAALVTLDAKLVTDAAGEFDLDPEHGGFGRPEVKFRGTKFPRAAALQFLLHQPEKNADLAKLVNLTLDKMAGGGIYDHLGGGFHRYSTERTWTVPHFEKMLYDNAQLVELYADAHARKANPLYRRTVDETLAFVARELTASDGYFYSALDADSDGEEGRFYVWTDKELDALLGTGPEPGLFRIAYGLDKPNFEEKYFILRTPKPLAEVAKDRKVSEEDLRKKLEPFRAKLLDVRAKRNRPFLDTKLIVAWNGQMIAAQAAAGKALAEPKYTAAAEKAAAFILANLRGKDGRLLRTYAAKPGEKPTARGPAFLDDYAFLIHGLLTLHDATGKKEWLDAAKELQAQQQKWFGDDRGGYFNTASDGEKLFARGKDASDGAQPSANGLAARNLFRLWRATQADEYRAAAVKCVKTAATSLKAQPTSVPVMADTLAALIAANGLDTTGAVKEPPPPPANPKASADVVGVAVREVETNEKDARRYEVTLTVAKGWHVYANPVGPQGLAESVTVVEVLADGKPVTGDITYPKGTVAKDPAGGEASVYTGAVTVAAKVPAEAVHGKAVGVRVKVVACDDKNCLAPSTIKADPTR